MSLRNYIKKNDKKLGISLEATWLKASEIHERQTRPGENINGIAHCEAVENNIFRFLKESSSSKRKLIQNIYRFPTSELYILSCAACLHDIDKGVTFETLGGEFLHGEGSSEFVLKNWEKLSIYSLTYAKFIAQVISVHDFKDDFYDQMKRIPKLHGGVNLQCLATLLKACDTLHFDDSRISHLAVSTESLDGFAYKKQLVRSSVLHWAFNGERIEVDYSFDQKEIPKEFHEFEEYFVKHEWPPVEKGLDEFQFPHLISFNRVVFRTPTNLAKPVQNDIFVNPSRKEDKKNTNEKPIGEPSTIEDITIEETKLKGPFKLIDEIREEVPKRILIRQKDNLTIFRIGSNAQLQVGADIRHQVCDIDYLIISRKKVEIALIRSIKRKLDQICKDYSADDIEVNYQLVNGAFKPESKSSKISILIHILLHEEKEFLNTQPRIFLFSWFNAIDFKQKSELKEIISPIYDGSPPKMSHVLHEDYGIKNLYERISSIEDYFEFYAWDEKQRENTNLLRKLKRKLGRYERIDFIHYAVLWSVCNVMRAIEGTSTILVDKESTINSFIKSFSSSFNTNDFCRFLKLVYHRRYKSTSAYRDLSEDEEEELLNDAKRFLLDLIYVLENNEKNKIELHLESLKKIYNKDYNFLIQTLPKFTEINNDQKNNTVSEILLYPLFGCDLEEETRGALVDFLKSPSGFTQIFKKVIWRRLYYYLERVRVLSYLQKPEEDGSLIDQSNNETVNNLHMNLERYVSDFSIKARNANSLRDLASLSETLTDEKVFTICRILSIKEQCQLVFPSELINYLIAEVSDTIDQFIDDSNLWWATYFFIKIKNSLDTFRTNESIRTIILKVIQNVQTRPRFPIPENTDKNITSEIHGELRTRLYILINTIRILEFLCLKHSEFLPSKDYLIENLKNNLSWIVDQETNNFYLITLRIEVLVRYFKLIEYYRQKLIKINNAP